MAKTEEILGMNMISIPSGSFMMGHTYRHDPALPENVNKFYNDELPVHKVDLKAFMLGETPVTQGQYEKVAGENPSTFSGDDMLPMTNIGPAEIRKFCNMASKTAGLEKCFDEESGKCDFAKNGFRMPTEQEWEYACRAGTTTLFNTGNTEKDLDSAGWYIGNSGRKTHPVARKKPNAWGLYDMHGNVLEFCSDDWNPAMCYGKYLVHENTDPEFHYYFSLNVTRGGCWFSEPSVCRSATRACFCSWAGINQSWYTGMRVARSIV